MTIKAKTRMKEEANVEIAIEEYHILDKMQNELAHQKEKASFMVLLRVAIL